MTQITLYDGKIVIRGNKIGTGKDCCCDDCDTNPIGDFISIELLRTNYDPNPQCDGMRTDSQTINIPQELPSPICVRIVGGVDDDLAINGQIIEPGLHVKWPLLTCNPSHPVDYYFTTEEKSFTVEAVDNWGGVITAQLVVYFYNSCVCKGKDTL